MHFWLFIILLVCPIACSKSSSSSKSKPAAAKTTSAKKTTASTSPALTTGGQSSGYVTSSYSGVGTLALSPLGLLGPMGLLASSSNTCDSGTYEVSGVGYSSVFSSGSFENSTFSKVKSPNTDAVMTLSCADKTIQRCFIKAGDKGVLCNKIADSVLTAFEAALGKKLSDSSYVGAHVSKVASAIVTAAQISGPETDQFISDLQNCASSKDEKTCYQDAIARSPFFDSFKIMQQITQGWSAEGLFVFATGVLGRKVQLDSFLYSSVFDALAEVRGDGFIESVRDLISKVVKSQKAQDGKYSFAIKCSVSINGDSKYFDPDLDTKDHIICNKEDLDSILQNAGIDSSHWDGIATEADKNSIPCSVANANGNCSARVSMEAVSVNVEADRNDINGTNTSARAFEEDISLVDVMPQVNKAMTANKIPMDENGPPDINASNKAGFIKALTKTQNYFLGLMGVYKFLNDKDMSNKKISLNDIQDIFVGDKFLRTRLVGWGPSFTGLQVSNNFYSPILTPGLKDGNYSINSIFNMTLGNSSTPSVNTTSFDKVFSASAPKFHDTFSMFAQIPTSTEIENSVFNTSHHEEWNPMGSKYFQVAEWISTGQPITCMMENQGPGQSLIDGTTLTCDSKQTGVSCDSDGACTFPDDYAYPYILLQRGWYGDDQGAVYSLAGRKDGLGLRSNGGEGVLVKEYKSGNPSGHCDAKQIGKVIQYIEQIDCGANTKCEQKNTAYCMDLSSFGAPARKHFYPGGQITVTNQSADGSHWNFQVPLIAVYDGSDHANDTSACLFVPQSSFISSSTQGTVADTNVNASSGFLSLTGISGAAIKACTTDANSGYTKYYLYNWNDFANNDAMYVWLLDAAQNFTVQYTTANTQGNPWESTYAKIRQADVQSLLSGKTIAGSAVTQINQMRFHNPRHDSKFDPYCDDVNGNGFCDCYPIDTISDDRQTVTYKTTARTNPKECGLMDKAAEPTISQLPYCIQCPGASDAKAFFDKFGGKAGSDLSDVGAYLQSHQVNADFNQAVFCQYKFSDQAQVGQPQSIDWGHWGDATHPGCPTANGEKKTSSSQGPIRLINPKPMRNAFDVSKPNTLIKLINYATKTIGQGISVDPTKPVFSVDEAMALMAVRSLLPPSGLTVQDSNGNAVNSLSIYFQSMLSPDSKMGSFSAMIKGIFFKAGVYSEADVDLQD